MIQRREPVAVVLVLLLLKKREAVLGEGGPQVVSRALEKWLGLLEVGVIGDMGATRTTREVGITRTETTIRLGTELEFKKLRSVSASVLCHFLSGIQIQTSSGTVPECPTEMAILGRMGE